MPPTTASPEPIEEIQTADTTTDAGDDQQATDVDRLKRALEAERKLNRENAARAARLEAQMKELGQANPQLVAEAQAKALAAEQQRQLIEQQTTSRLQEQERKFQEQLARVTGDLQSAKQRGTPARS